MRKKKNYEVLPLEIGEVVGEVADTANNARGLEVSRQDPEVGQVDAVASGLGGARFSFVLCAAFGGPGQLGDLPEATGYKLAGFRRAGVRDHDGDGVRKTRHRNTGTGATVCEPDAGRAGARYISRIRFLGSAVQRSFTHRHQKVHVAIWRVGPWGGNR